MPYIPHSKEDRQAMLQAIGMAAIEDLFEDVPQSARFPELDLPEALSENLLRTLPQTLGEDQRGEVVRGAISLCWAGQWQVGPAASSCC